MKKCHYFQILKLNSFNYEYINDAITNKLQIKRRKTMAIRNILRSGNPILRERSTEFEIDQIQTQATRQLVADMFETMEAANGQGLAAPQIGELKRVVIVRLFRDENYIDRVLFNPKIKVVGKSKLGSWEGCLSVPGFVGYVERIRRIELEFYDESAKKNLETVEGYDAVVYQHECDHLDGILYTDRMTDSRLFGFDDTTDARELRALVKSN